MKQSTVIFGVLLFAFVIYVTMRGQLPGYLALFKPKAAQPSVTNTDVVNSGSASGYGQYLKNSGLDISKYLNMFNGGKVDVGAVAGALELAF